MKFITGLIVSAVVSLLLMAGAVLALGHVCSPQGLMAPWTKPVPIRFDDGHGYRLEAPALLLRVQFAEPPGNARPAPLDWRRNFLCEIKATDIAIAGFGLFLVLSIVFQSLFQGLFMRRVLAASDRTGRVVDEALIAAQRAYLFLREFRVNLVKNPLNEEIQTCTIQPIWENTGATPTRNGRSHINWKFFERSIPSEFDFPDFDEVGNRVLSYDAYQAFDRRSALDRACAAARYRAWNSAAGARRAGPRSGLGLGRIRRSVRRRQAAPHRILLPARGDRLARLLGRLQPIQGL